MATATIYSSIDQRGAGGVRRGGLTAARRHTRSVRLLRLSLPAVAVGAAAVYVLSMMTTAGITTGLPDLDVGRVLNTDLKMQNPHYEGFGKDGSSYQFAAKTAQQDLLKPDFVKLEGITGQLLQADNTRTDVTAAHGIFDNKASILELTGGIDVVSQNGTKVRMPNATVQTKESLLVSKDPVVVEFPAGTINAVGMTLRQKAREVTFASEVVAHLKPAKPPGAAEAAPEAKQAADAAAAGGMFGKSDAPLDVTSQRLDIQDNSKVAIFTGAVKAKQGESALETPELSVSYGTDVKPGADAGKAAAPASDPLAGAAGKVKQITAKGPVVMTRGTTDRVTSDKADFDAQKETGVLTGNVVMTSGPERRATGDRVDLDQRAQTVLLTGGNVVVTQGKNEMRGQRLMVDRKAATSQLTSPQTGRISAQFYQAPKKPGTASKGEAAAAAEPGAAASFTAFKTDPNAPIKLQAHQLDVNDTAKTAIFSGDVVAEQGDFVMKTAEMHVAYTGATGLADVTGPAAGAAKGASAQITEIHAKRKVVVNTKDGRTVNGDWADFDMKANKVIVGGDVVLTQGKNVVRGTRLVIDMISGESAIDVAPAKAGKSDEGWQATDTGDGVSVKGGRPSAVFYPQQLKDKMKKKD